ncbi:MAG TPA: hypothetical protein VGQ93_12160 [Lysobacter sp.]|jgi:hypothetical protein|nr:hypothetical protein [Lysobacter sp.]
MVLSNAERQRRWRARLKSRAAGSIQVPTVDPETMTEAELKAEFISLRDTLRANLARLLRLLERLTPVSYARTVDDAGGMLLDLPQTTIEDLIAKIDRSIAGPPPMKKWRRKTKKART